jgi:CRP-like cAMP-binding protein
MSLTASIVTLIERHGFFVGIPQRMAAAIGALAVERKVAMDEMLLRQGEPANHVFLVYSGKVSVELFAPGRDPIVVEQLGAGDVVGWSWLCLPYRWSFDARAVEPSTVIDIDAAALRARFDADPALGYEVLRRFVPVMSRRLSSSRERMVECVIDKS